MDGMNHTPGEWFLDPGDKGDSSVGLPGWMPFVYANQPNGDPFVLCTLHVPGYRVEPDPGNEYDDGIREAGDIVANGLVMAAAPELLAALVQIVRDWDSVSETARVPDEINDTSHWDAARAAIAKAAGNPAPADPAGEARTCGLCGGPTGSESEAVHPACASREQYEADGQTP